MTEHSDWQRLKANLEFEEARASMERQVNDWLDEAVREFEKKGGMDNLKGKGKPLELATGDPLYGVLKTANVKPRWLELQHEIRDGLTQLSKGLKQGTAVHAEQTVLEMNKKITIYNKIVPHYTMQRTLIDLATLEEQLKTWE